MFAGTCLNVKSLDVNAGSNVSISHSHQEVEVVGLAKIEIYEL